MITKFEVGKTYTTINGKEVTVLKRGRGSVVVSFMEEGEKVLAHWAISKSKAPEGREQVEQIAGSDSGEVDEKTGLSIGKARLINYMTA